MHLSGTFPRRIAIIGAGLAGACVLRALAGQAAALGYDDLQVFLIDAHAGPAQGASAVPVGVAHPLASRDHNLASQFFLQGIGTLARWADELSGLAEGWADFSGVDHQVGQGNTHSVRQPGGWVQPDRFVAACIAQARGCLGTRLHLRYGAGLAAEDFVGLCSTYDVVILTTAGDALLPQAGLALQPLPGQVSWVSVPKPSHSPPLHIPRVLSGQGFLTPVIAERVQFGATFHRAPSPAGVSLEDHQRNITQLYRLAPEIAGVLSPQPEACGGWAGVRHATRDRMPHIGQPVSPSVYARGVLGWQLPRSVSQLRHLPRHNGVYLLLGLGARGLSSAPLGAEEIAASVFGLAPVLSVRLGHAVDPGRFVLREHARAWALPRG
jgi:tRNA 5-methylaminomethyl-2-thiouridine biosynthesis bifunctional protein